MVKSCCIVSSRILVCVVVDEKNCVNPITNALFQRKRKSKSKKKKVQEKKDNKYFKD